MFSSYKICGKQTRKIMWHLFKLCDITPFSHLWERSVINKVFLLAKATTNLPVITTGSNLTPSPTTNEKENGHLSSYYNPQETNFPSLHNHRSSVPSSLPSSSLPSSSSPTSNSSRSKTSAQTLAIAFGCAVGAIFVISAIVIYHRKSTARANKVTMIQVNVMNAAPSNETDCSRNEVSSRSLTPENDE